MSAQPQPPPPPPPQSDNPFFNDPSVSAAVSGSMAAQTTVAVLPVPEKSTAGSSPAQIAVHSEQRAVAVDSVKVAIDDDDYVDQPESTDATTTNPSNKRIKGSNNFNYPPFPMWIRVGPIKPCYRIDIEEEIPVYAQRTVGDALKISQLIGVAWFWNWVCALAGLSCHSCGGSDVQTVILATIFGAMFIPSSFACWFNPLYTALKKDSSVRFGWFFFTSGFQVVCCVLFAIGIPGSGGAGFWLAADVMKSSIFAGLMIISSGLLWLGLGGVVALLAKRILHIYQTTTGDSGQTAGEEMDSGLLNSEAVSSMASSAVSHIFSSK